MLGNQRASSASVKPNWGSTGQMLCPYQVRPQMPYTVDTLEVELFL